MTAITLFVTGQAQASDWYVDPVLGNDANIGTSPGTAWKTITHATATAVPTGGTETIHLSPGLYDQASGEVFPLLVLDRQQIVGDGGASVTLIGVPSLSSGFQIWAEPTFNSGGVTAATKLSGMTIRDGTRGVDMRTGGLPCDPILQDLAIQGCTWGISLYFDSPVVLGPVPASPELSQIRLQANHVGVSIASTSSNPILGMLRIEDCAFVDNPVSLDSNLNMGQLRIELDRTVMQGTTLYAISVSGGYAGLALMGTTLVLRDCVIMHNQFGGVRLLGPFDQGLILGCTIVDSGLGVYVANYANLEIANSIVWGNLVDLQLLSGSVVRHCDYATSSIAFGPSNLHVDPMFRDEANGDYRLRFGSPCVDSADPVGGTPTDFTGTARRMDGNLDTVGAPDIGAYELQTLSLSGTPSIGQRLGFEFLGAAGMSSTLYVAPHGTFPPQSTPFGLLYLSPVLTSPSATVVVQPGPPFVLRRRIPNNPALIGTYYSFQALTNSALAPAGRAYTNPITFVITP